MQRENPHARSLRVGFFFSSRVSRVNPVRIGALCEAWGRIKVDEVGWTTNPMAIVFTTRRTVSLVATSWGFSR